MIVVYIGILVIALVVFGDSQPKIALGIAALILFGAILINQDLFTKILGITPNATGFGGFGGSSTLGLYSGSGGSSGSGSGRT